MKTRTFLYGGIITAGVVVAGIGIASAAGFMGGAAGGPGAFGGGFGGAMNFSSPTDLATQQATQFQNEATMLGISVSAVADGWSKGESLNEIASDNGISTSTLSTDMQTYSANQLQAELNALVANGTITQAQADARLSFDQAQQSKIQSMQSQHNGSGPMGFRGHGPRSSTSTPPTSGQAP